MKAQVAMETIVYTGILIFVLGISAYVAVQRERMILSERVSIDTRSLAESIADEINIAAGVGDGYSHSFTLPDYIAGSVNYTVEIVNEEQKIYVMRDNASYAASILASNVAGYVKKGRNVVRNEGGVVAIE